MMYRYPEDDHGKAPEYTYDHYHTYECGCVVYRGPIMNKMVLCDEHNKPNPYDAPFPGRTITVGGYAVPVHTSLDPRVEVLTGELAKRASESRGRRMGKSWAWSRYADGIPVNVKFYAPILSADGRWVSEDSVEKPPA